MDLSLLNENQKKGVVTTSQYTRIIAGAGSGKTRVLTNRIAYLIENGFAYPSGILGITFTNKAAAEIRERVLKIIPDASSMSLCTIHSWCAKFLRMECKQINYPSSFIILDEDDAHSVMKDIFVSHGKNKNDPDIKKCLNWIAAKKTAGFQYEDLKDEQYPNKEMRDFLSYFKEYDAKLKEMFAFDFDDLLLKTIEILENKENGVQRKYQRRITHILVDEFQDINDVQFHLITLLLSPTCELYVVGDPDQTIYTWRGANNRIIIEFEKTLKSIYPSAEVETIILNLNYRSTKTILTCANKLIAYNQERVKKDLYATQDDGQEIALFKANRSMDEASYVANTIKEIHKEGYKYKDIAVLYRMNYLTRELESQFNLHQIPYRIYGGLKFFQRKEIKDVLAYLTLLVNPMYDIGFSRIINVPKRNIGQTSLDKLKEGAEANSQSLFLYILENDDLPLTPAKNIALKNMVSILMHYKEEIATCEAKLIPVKLEQMLTDLEYDRELQEEPAKEDERRDNITELFVSMAQYYNSVEEPTFEGFIENCALQSSQDEVKDGDFVSLMTIHTAKGLEFDDVFIYGFNDGIFPSRRAIEESNRGIEEERRLAYVALTRARKKLYLTCNQDFSPIMSEALRPSRFIKESGLQFKEETKHNFVTKNSWSYMPKTKPVIQTKVEIKTNGVKSWCKGDRLKHESFGLGTVLEVNNKLIVVQFDNDKFGKKTLLASHYMIQKLIN